MRVAAWALVGKGPDGWWAVSEPCPGRQTIGRADLAAVSQVLHSGTPGTMVSACRGIVLKRLAIQQVQLRQEELGKGTNADMWVPLRRLLLAEACWSFVRQPSRLTQEQAVAEGWADEDWEGNNRADDAAKAQAMLAEPALELLAKWAEQQLAVQAPWRLIAQSQVAHLAERLPETMGPP